MDIIINNRIFIDKPTKEIKDYCRHNLVLSNPEYEKKVRLNLWVGETPKKIYLYEQRGESLILPYGCLRDIIPLLSSADNIETKFIDTPDIDYKADIPLYDYQEEAVKWMEKSKYGILKAPAGSGKTQMGIALIGNYGKRALWITHTQDLLNQSYNRAKQYIDESLLGTITDGKVSVGEGITFATIQTLARVDLTFLSDYWDVVIVDECHRVSGSPTVVSQFYKVLNQLSAKHKYGVSATVHRADGMINATFALLGRIIYEVPEEAVGNKIMSVGIKNIPTGIGISDECLNYDGTLNHAKLISYLAECNVRNRLIVENIEYGKSTLVLSDRIAQLQELMEMLPDEERKKAAMVHGKMTSKSDKILREQIIQDMRDGNLTYLFASYSLAKEGLDIPRLERLYMATPVKDYAVVVQSIGRIARQFEGKTKSVCYDFVDNMSYTLKAYKKRWTSYRKCKCYEVENESY